MTPTAGRISYASTYLCSFKGTLAPPELIGEVPEGLRANFYSTGGTITGERLRGTVRPVGGDWMTIRRDGIGAINVRTTFETHDGAAILVTYEGVVDLGPDGYEKFAQGDLPKIVTLRIAPRFVTSHADYLWLNRLFCYGIGKYDSAANAATYDIYAVA